MDTLGTRLIKQREHFNLSLKDVSEKIKIRPHILQAFEEDNFEVLPAVYARSSVKAYANFLKISDKEFNQLLPESLKPKIQPVVVPLQNIPERIEANFKKSILNKENLYNKRNIINYLIYGGIGLALFSIVYFIFFEQNSQKEKISNQNASDTTVIAEKGKGLLSFFDKPDSVVLEARAIDTAWLRVDIDGKTSEVVHMAPNLMKRWSAEQYFLLTVGNVGSIEFRRDGNVLKPFGTKGSVVRNIKITKSEVVNSSQPWTDQDSTRLRRKAIKKEEPQTQPKLIEPSTIDVIKPFEKKEKKEPR